MYEYRREFISAVSKQEAAQSNHDEFIIALAQEGWQLVSSAFREAKCPKSSFVILTFKRRRRKSSHQELKITDAEE